METELSVNISKLRKERGLTQRKAASELRISQALLSHYENGIREPGLDFVVRACDYYGVSADFLLGRTNIRETVLAKGATGPDSEGQSNIDKLKQDAISLVATIFRMVTPLGDEVAIPALNYIISSDYRLLCQLFSITDTDLITADRRKGTVLSEVDMTLLCLNISEELARQSAKLTAEIVRKSVSKTTYKSFETIIAKTEERLEISAPKADNK
jgi:transcriptional regulator with XRE-family HTH domain